MYREEKKEIKRRIGQYLYEGLPNEIKEKKWKDFYNYLKKYRRIIIIFDGYLLARVCAKKFKEYDIRFYSISYAFERKMLNHTHRISHITELERTDFENSLVLFCGINDLTNLSNLLSDLDSYENFFVYESMYSNELYWKLRRDRLRNKYSKEQVTPAIREFCNNNLYPIESCGDKDWKDFFDATQEAPIAVFGAGVACKELLLIKRIKPEIIVDNSKEKWGSCIGEVPIYPPEVLREKRYVVLVSSTKDIESIEEQLAGMGINTVFSFAKLEKRRIFSARKSFKSRLRYISRKIRMFMLYNLFPIQKNKIVVNRHEGLGYGCNQKYVCDEMIKYPRKFHIVWLVNSYSDLDSLPEGIHGVINTYKNRTYHMATAKILMWDGIMSVGVKKRRGQYCINTTHGCGVSLKKFGFDAPKTITEASRMNILHDSEIEDMYVAGSQSVADFYKTAFLTQCPIALIGSPRVDSVINQDSIISQKVRKYFGIGEHTNIVLYAPTFRAGKYSKGVRSDDTIEQYNLLPIDFICRTLAEKYGGEWFGLLRFHPMASFLGNKIQYDKSCANASYYNDVNELIVASQVVISDYSSLIFDAMFGKKPVILYTPDYDTYVQQERDFYYKLSSLPFPVSKNKEEFADKVKDFNYEKYLYDIGQFVKPMKIMEDGFASKRLCHIIDKLMTTNPINIEHIIDEAIEAYPNNKVGG